MFCPRAGIRKRQSRLRNLSFNFDNGQPIWKFCTYQLNLIKFQSNLSCKFTAYRKKVEFVFVQPITMFNQICRKAYILVNASGLHEELDLRIST